MFLCLGPQVPLLRPRLIAVAASADPPASSQLPMAVILSRLPCGPVGCGSGLRLRLDSEPLQSQNPVRVGTAARMYRAALAGALATEPATLAGATTGP